MTDFFANLRVLITGAASGIGLATAHLLAQRGARLYLVDMNSVALASVAQNLNAPFSVVDITDAAAVQHALDNAAQTLGGLDAVIHCAGILSGGLITELALETQRRIIDVNLFGTLAVIRAATPHIKRSQGSLILAGSVAAFYGAPEEAIYSATKAGVVSLAQAARLELDGSGVHIGVFCPHFVNTPMVQQNPDVKLFKLIGSQHTAEDIAWAIARGIERRQFMILPSLTVRYVWFMSHYFHWAMYPVLRRSWRRARTL